MNEEKLVSGMVRRIHHERRFHGVYHHDEKSATGGHHHQVDDDEVSTVSSYWSYEFAHVDEPLDHVRVHE